MKLNIHKKVLILVLGAGLVTFFVLGTFAYYGGKVVHDEMTEMSGELGKMGASYTAEVLTEQIKQTFGELAEARAQYIDREMSIMCENAKVLANAMTEIFSHPENFPAKTLADPRNSAVKMCEPYIIYAPTLRDNVTPEIQQEIALAANIKGLLAEILRTYDGCNATAFVGSENGWHIVARILLEEDGKVDFNKQMTLSHERVYEFDPRRRPWYISAKNAGAPVISELYRTIEADGYQQIGASAPFYDASGKLLGVAGVDASNIDIYHWINETNSSESV
ncbi:MAG: hypothetical protein J5497_08640, partial [Selenomonadaceae bacterium]|nr:hypothetical protein [Selenomonadaceae bacterium]